MSPQPNPSPEGPQIPPQPTPPQYFAEKSQATLALILGIVGLIACTIVSPVAWVIGNNEVKAIDAGRRAPDGRQMATIGKVLGIIGTIMLGLAVVLVIILVIAGMVSSINVS